MLNRRHLRIKVLQLLYAYYQSEEDNFPKAEKELLLTIERMYDMYLFLLLTFSEVKRAAENNLADKGKKMRPTEEDLHPNKKWVDNKIVTQLEDSFALRHLTETRKVNWMGAESQEMFRKIFLQVVESEVYFEYMNNGQSGYDEDKHFVLALFKEDIANSSVLYHFFEEKSINWLDDLDLCCSMAIKSIKGMTENVAFEPLPLFKENDDEKELVGLYYSESMDPDGRGHRNLIRMMMEDGFFKYLPKGDDAWVSFLKPFLKLTRKEKQKFRNKKK